MNLRELRQLRQQATPGPWTSTVSGDAVYVNADNYGITCGLTAHYGGKLGKGGTGEGNGAFIAAMANHCDALLDIAEAAQAGHRFPGHDCLPFTVIGPEGTAYCALCEALARLGSHT